MGREYRMETHRLPAREDEELLPTVRGDFSSVQNFDAHQLGKGQAHRWSPEHEDGFRCMNDEELERAGFELNEYGRWHRPRATDIRILAA